MDRIDSKELTRRRINDPAGPQREPWGTGEGGFYLGDPVHPVCSLMGSSVNGVIFGFLTCH
jgi:hypothetical protein